MVASMAGNWAAETVDWKAGSMVGKSVVMTVSPMVAKLVVLRGD